MWKRCLASRQGGRFLRAITLLCEHRPRRRRAGRGLSRHGKLDLVVGVFGLHDTGEILLLENQTTNWAKPEFVPRVIDKRHGTIHVPVADLNGDGKPDFVALIARSTRRSSPSSTRAAASSRRRRSIPPRIRAGAAAASSWWT